jgi:hypothetical protein
MPQVSTETPNGFTATLAETNSRPLRSNLLGRDSSSSSVSLSSPCPILAPWQHVFLILFLFYPLSANLLHFRRLNGTGENLFPANPKVFSCFGVYPTLSREILGYFLLSYEIGAVLESVRGASVVNC